MTSPLSPEAVAQMVADREAGTPGPWRESQTWRPPIGNGPHSDMVNGNIFWGYSISGSNEGGGHIYPTLAAVHNFPDHIHANARRIARLPDLEAAYLTLAAENATLRAERDEALRLLDNSRQIERNVQSVREHEHKRAEAALSDLATLRASEAAALERESDMRQALQAAMDDTPTADKEPKT